MSQAHAWEEGAQCTLLSTRGEEVRRYRAGKPARVLVCTLPSHFVEALLEPSSDLVCLSHTALLSWHRVCSRARPHLCICRLGRLPHRATWLAPAGFRPGFSSQKPALASASELGTRAPPHSEPGDRGLSALCSSPPTLSWHYFLCSSYNQLTLPGYLLIACLLSGAS